MGSPYPTQDIHAATSIALITASSSVLNPRPRSIYVSVAGTIAMENDDGTTATITGVAGVTIPLQIYKVTGGTATVYGLYDGDTTA